MRVSHDLTLWGLEAKQVEVELVTPPNPKFPPIHKVTMPHLTLFISPPELAAIGKRFCNAAVAALAKAKAEE